MNHFYLPHNRTRLQYLGNPQIHPRALALHAPSRLHQVGYQPAYPLYLSKSARESQNYRFSYWARGGRVFVLEVWSVGSRL